jgi:hypothetical protein
MRGAEVAAQSNKCNAGAERAHTVLHVIMCMCAHSSWVADRTTSAAAGMHIVSRCSIAQRCGTANSSAAPRTSYPVQQAIVTLPALQYSAILNAAQAW